MSNAEGACVAHSGCRRLSHATSLALMSFSVTICLTVCLLLQLGFKDDIDPALSLQLISRSILAFLNRHLPLTDAQRDLLEQSQKPNNSHQNAGAADSNHTDALAAASHEVSDAAQQTRSSKSHKVQESQQQNGQLAGMQAGVVANGVLSDEHSSSSDLSGRTCDFRVKADERELFQQVCKGHIAKLELSL